MNWPAKLSRIWLGLLLLGFIVSWRLDLQPGRMPFLPGALPPGSAQALLGTDHLGRNIGLGLLLGIPSLLALAVPSMLLSLILALAAAYILSNKHRLNISIFYLASGLGSGLLLLASLPWLPYFPLWLLLLLCGVFSLPFMLPNFGPCLSVPLHGLIRLLQIIIVSIPGIMLLFSINPDSYLELILLLGGTSWVALSQFSEQTMLEFFKGTAYQSAKSLGIPTLGILRKHFFRSLLRTLRPQVAWLLSGFIVLEGSLGFLGLGLPEQHWGWGQMLRLGLQHAELWWSWLFAGLSILFTVLSSFILLHSRHIGA